MSGERLFGRFGCLLGGSGAPQKRLARTRRLLPAAAVTFVLGATLGPVPASAAEGPESTIVVTPETLTTALFVAGDINRLSKTGNGTEELVLEKALQQMYIHNPSLPTGQAFGEIRGLKRILECHAAPTPASLQVMAGNQRILAILSALEIEVIEPSCSSIKVAELQEAKLAVTHLASIALAGSSSIFAQAETPKYFEPAADERANLIYTSFAPAAVLRATRETARHNKPFGSARDALWRAASKESVFAELPALVLENKNLNANPRIEQLLEEHTFTPDSLATLFASGQTATQEQLCEHGAGEEAIGGDTIPGVPRLSCNGGALYEAARAAPCTEPTCPARLKELQAKARGREELVEQGRSLMNAAAELLRPAESTAASVEQATAQAQSQIAEEEGAYAKFEAEQKTRNIIKGSLKIVGDVAGAAGVAYAKKEPLEAVNGLVSAAFEIYQLIEESVTTPPPGPQEIALEDISDLGTQLAGFQQYTQEALRALNTQLGQIAGELAQDTYNLKGEIGSLAERLASEQQTIFALENEVQTLFSTQAKAELQTTIADSVGWLKRTGESLAPSKIQESLIALEKYATEIANGALVNKNIQPYTFRGADVQLTDSNTGEPDELNEAITYLAHFPVEQGWETSAIPSNLPNTTFWSEGARAYAQVMLENTRNVTGPDKAGLKTLEKEGVKLEKAQEPWSVESSGPPTGNEILNHAVQSVERAASGTGLEGHESVSGQLHEAAEAVLDKHLVATGAGTQLTPNPTHLSLWTGAEESVATEEIENDFPHVFNQKETEKEELSVDRPLVPHWLVTGLRLGTIGYMGSGDAYEVEVEYGYWECPLITVKSAATLPPPASGNRLSFFPKTCEPDFELVRDKGIEFKIHPEDEHPYVNAINRSFLTVQRRAYESAVPALKQEPVPAEALAGARALVESYVKLGLPQALSTDPVLEDEIQGTGSQFLDPEPGTPRPVPEELLALVESWRAVVEKDEGAALELGALESVAERDFIDEIRERSSKWTSEVGHTVTPYIRGVPPELTENGGEAVSEEAPLVESTVNRLRLTRDVLSQAKVPGAETLAPTDIGSTEATLNGEVAPNDGEVESCEFEYGSTESYDHRVACTAIPPTIEKAFLVSAPLTNWTQSSSLHYRVVAKTWGGTAYGEDVKLVLSSGGGGGGSSPPSVVTTGVAIGSGDAMLEGTVNPHGKNVTSCQFTVERLMSGLPGGESKTIPCASGPGAGTVPTAVSGLVTGLSPETEYSFVLSAENELGKTISAPPEEFMTSTAVAPTVVTGEANQIKRRMALLHGTINPNGIPIIRCWATIEEEAKKEAPLSFSCINGPGLSHQPEPILVNGRKLHPGTKYIFRLHAENSEGVRVEGAPALGCSACGTVQTLGKPKKKKK